MALVGKSIAVPLTLLGPVLVAIILIHLLPFLLLLGGSSIDVSLSLPGPVLVAVILLPTAVRLAARILDLVILR